MFWYVFIPTHNVLHGRHRVNSSNAARLVPDRDWLTVFSLLNAVQSEIWKAVKKGYGTYSWISRTEWKGRTSLGSVQTAREEQNVADVADAHVTQNLIDSSLCPGRRIRHLLHIYEWLPGKALTTSPVSGFIEWCAWLSRHYGSRFVRPLDKPF